MIGDEDQDAPPFPPASPPSPGDTRDPGRDQLRFDRSAASYALDAIGRWLHWLGDLFGRRGSR